MMLVRSYTIFYFYGKIHFSRGGVKKFLKMEKDRGLGVSATTDVINSFV